VDLQNDFTTGDNHYPKNHRQQTLHLLDKYSKTVVAKVTHSEGTSFVQGGGRGGRGGGGDNTRHESSYDKKWWKTRECYLCHKKGHPPTHCPNIANRKGSDKDDDDKSVTSTVSSASKLKKDFKSMKKAFTTVNTQLKELKEADSDISESDGDEEASHFQVDDSFQFQFAQVNEEFEPRIANLFKQNHGSTIKFDLREVILLDSQSTMDLFCNQSLVEKTYNSGSSTMRLKSNGGTMVVTHKAIMPGCKKPVWFSTRASITNIIALRNLIEQYCVT
jgi:hypothetical protein